MNIFTLTFRQLKAIKDNLSQQIFTKVTNKTLEKGVKYVQS